MKQKEEQYQILLKKAESLLSADFGPISNMANLSALLFDELKQINWAGFYILEGDKLTLGPFQGKPACVQIAVGKGVCGTCAKQMDTVIVDDVHNFPGHIACDSASRSEIVVPIIMNGKLVAVLDIDSPITDRFDEIDKIYLEKIVKTL
ncbi:MAG: GAF domain-containing protein [Elusimicrobiaceae bacterium]|jgi:L-methionine (R)-S-oxide reductase|nr:GAF domain-containing protein [Elusimicrobiaceae bacterium]MBT4008198.1 GAF domain-containing protein [Elusimicrobiaceae bacterium]MBT4403064.1 GAF domain-containing protein [Elusimicrobiaceae bacterium]MBT5986955.1 GAF domain-containing protein [Elusimicrobiaceae bacterium]MBT6715647.1 GAF domain-containing protein [Elusimicrobiaceae bacterium]